VNSRAFKCNAGSVESGYARLQHRHSDDEWLNWVVKFP